MSFPNVHVVLRNTAPLRRMLSRRNKFLWRGVKNFFRRKSIRKLSVHFELIEILRCHKFVMFEFRTKTANTKVQSHFQYSLENVGHLKTYNSQIQIKDAHSPNSCKCSKFKSKHYHTKSSIIRFYTPTSKWCLQIWNSYLPIVWLSFIRCLYQTSCHSKTNPSAQQ